jgi:hypothetical protein
MDLNLLAASGARVGQRWGMTKIPSAMIEQILLTGVR